MSDILLVEDSRVQALTYKRLFEKAGHSVRHAATAEEALQYCLQATPDLVVLDQYLGERSGLEVCRRLKGDITLQVIPILALTGSQKERDHIAALEAGADRFLSKESSDDQLLAMVNGLLKSAITVEAIEGDDDSRDLFLRGGRLLAIDDSRTYLNELSKKLTESGFQVSTALSGAEGLALMERESFHVAIVDVVMPEMDGFQVCKQARLRADERQKQLGLLILSGQENRQVLLEALASGADDFVSKSQDMDVILAHIQSLVRRVRMMRHIHAINQKRYAQELALHEAEWKRQQAEERATNAESRSALYEELESVAVELQRSKEELEIAKAAAEAASLAKSEFLANMSHEIRTPMNGVIGMADILSRTSLAPEQRDYLRMIQQSADALLRLLNDILDFSKIEAGKLELEAVDFSLRDCVGRTGQTLAIRAAEKGLELACRIEPELPDTLCGDPGRLRQILVNLAGNAIKFTEQGEVVIDVSEDARSGDEICLHGSVTDTGIGMSPEVSERLFQPFMQADASTTRRFGGTGLGLAISRQLVELMHGRIWVESEVGCGTTFHFTVRLGLSPAAAIVPLDLSTLEEMPILVVDDNPTDRRIFHEVLKSWHLSPTEVASGPAGLGTLTEAARAGRPYKLVIVDFMMPDMDGFMFAERVRADSQLRDTALVMISSVIDADRVASSRDVGIARYLTKPVVQSELLNTILDVLYVPADGAEAPRRDSIDVPSRATLPLNILLAEDGLINQKVAVNLLQMAGHNVAIAQDGQQAVAAWERGSFDIVLMDVHMPEMDGFEATVAIREKEKTTGQHTPIIAMTASAMKGDRESCLAKGMDGYISKPVAREELYQVLAEFAPSGKVAPGSSPESAGTAREGADDIIDIQVALGIAGRMETVKELAELLLVEYPKLTQEIREGLANRDAKRVQRGAHTLKGSAAIFVAKRVVTAAERLEFRAKDGNLCDAEAYLAELEVALARMADAIKSTILAVAITT